MQPFPTAFWKTLGKESAPSPDSCLELETALVEDYTAETINTNKNDGSASYWNEYEDGEHMLQTPFVQLDRINGRNTSKEKFIKGDPHGDYEDNGECEFESLNEVVENPEGDVDRLDGYTPVSFLAELIKFMTIDDPIYTWDTKDPLCDIVDGPDDGDCAERYVNTIAKSFLYVWMKGTPPLKPDPITGDPTYTDSIHKATNRSNPFETSRSEDCQSCTIKLWFEKDAAQKSTELLASNSSEYTNIWGLAPKDADRFIQEFGYNGHRSTAGITSDHHYFYRQKATSKVTVTIGSPKTLTISIKGLGMDSNLDIWDIHLDADKRVKEVLLGYYDPVLDEEDNVITNNNLLQEENILLEKLDENGVSLCRLTTYCET